MVVFFSLLLTSTGYWWMLGTLILWIAAFVFGIFRLRFHALWLLLSLPLVLLPFVLSVLAAGQI